MSRSKAHQLRFEQMTGLMLAIAFFATATIAHAGTIVSGEWKVSVDETPSAQFIATAKQELSQYYPLLKSIVEDSNSWQADDIDEDGVYVVPTSDGCDVVNCVAIDHFRVSGGTTNQIAEGVAEFLEGIHEPFLDEGPYTDSPIYWKLIPGEYALLVATATSASLSSPIWSVSISAVPEPSSLLAIAITLVGALPLRGRSRSGA